MTAVTRRMQGAPVCVHRERDQIYLHFIQVFKYLFANVGMECWYPRPSLGPQKRLKCSEGNNTNEINNTPSKTIFLVILFQRQKGERITQ